MTKGVEVGGRFGELEMIFVFVLVAFIYLGWTYRTTDPDEFHTVARKAGLARCIATIFTVFGAPHFGIFTTLAFLYGWASIAFFIGVFAGLLILFMLTPKIRSYIPYDVHTFADIASVELGHGPARLLSFVGFAFTICVVATQLILGGNILQGVAGMNYNIAVFAFVVCVCGYLYWGGYKSLLYTDLVQGYVMFILTAIFAYYLWFSGISAPADGAAIRSVGSFNPLNDPFILFLFVGGVFAASGGPELWQRVLTAKSNAVARQSLCSAGTIMTAWGFFVVAAGVAISKISPSLEPSTAFVSFVSATLPAWMVGLVIMMLLAALISTADTELFASSIIGQKEWQRIRGVSDQPLDIWTTQMIVGGLGFFSFVIAIMFSNLVSALGVITNLGYIMGPLAFAIVLNRGGDTQAKKRRSFYIAFCMSAAGFAVVAFMNAFFSWWALLILVPAFYPFLFKGTDLGAGVSRAAE